MVFERKTAVVSIAIFLMIVLVAMKTTEVDGRIHVRRSLSDFGKGCCNVFIHSCCFPNHGLN